MLGKFNPDSYKIFNNILNNFEPQTNHLSQPSKTQLVFQLIIANGVVYTSNFN